MPIQEEEKTSGKPAAKARPILKPSSISDVNSIPIGQRQWIDIETQESNGACFFKCQNSSLVYCDSQEVYREANGAVHYDQVIDECKKKQCDNTEYWSHEMKKDFVNAPHWSMDLDISSGQGWRTKEKVSIQYCLNPNYLHQFLYLRSIQGHSGSTIIQHCNTMYCYQKGFTEYINHVGKRKRVEVDSESWFDSRKSQSQNKKTSCVLHCCDSDG